MTDPTAPQSNDAEARAAGLDCLRCGSRIQLAGVRDFRTGGSKGATLFFLGQWAELGEDTIPFELYACPSCRHVEFRAPA